MSSNFELRAKGRSQGLAPPPGGEPPILPSALEDQSADIRRKNNDSNILKRAEIAFCKDRAATATATKVQPIDASSRRTPQTTRIPVAGTKRHSLIEQEPPYEGSSDFALTAHGGVPPPTISSCIEGRNQSVRNLAR